MWIFVAFAPGAFLEAAELKPDTIRAWTAYVGATERRISAELDSGDRFLLLEFQSPARVSAELRAVLAGEIPVVGMTTLDEEKETIEIPSGMIHHWRGGVFIPGARLDEILVRVANPDDDDFRQEDVLEAAVLERGPASLHVFLKLRRRGIVTVVYNSEHKIRFRRHGDSRASSISVATRIAELANPNSPGERERPVGRDRGFLWRLNSYWRYQQVYGGVIVECESLSLSRGMPSVLAEVIRPLIAVVARDSLQRTLGALRDRHAASREDEGFQSERQRMRRGGDSPRWCAPGGSCSAPVVWRLDGPDAWLSGGRVERMSPASSSKFDTRAGAVRSPDHVPAWAFPGCGVELGNHEASERRPPLACAADLDAARPDPGGEDQPRYRAF